MRQTGEDSTTDTAPAGDDVVVIHYHRPPDKSDIYVQKIVHETPGCIVTFLEHTKTSRTMIIDGETALENDAPVIWFTFPGVKHDIGRFHLADGTHTGIYANIIEPVDIVSRNEWRATDLFLDVWIGRSGKAQMLDEDEVDNAVMKGWISERTALLAREEAQRIMDAAGKGAWPPPVVREWTLERVRGTLNGGAG